MVPASGNMQFARRQFWLGPDRSGTTVTFWASTEVIHPLIAGAPVKIVRSHLSAADPTALAASGGRPAGPPPLPPTGPGAAIEVDRIVSKDGPDAHPEVPGPLPGLADVRVVTSCSMSSSWL